MGLFDLITKIKKSAVTVVRKQSIENLEAELQHNDPVKASSSLVFSVFFGTAAVMTAVLGMGLHCIGIVYPALSLHLVFVAIISLAGGWFLGYCVMMAMVVYPATDDYAEARINLADMKYDDLKEKRVGRSAYQPKEGAP